MTEISKGPRSPTPDKPKYQTKGLRNVINSYREQLPIYVGKYPKEDRRLVKETAFGKAVQQETSSQLEEARTTDTRNGLQNEKWHREEFARRISESMRTGEPFWLVRGDIDDFRDINDAFDHSGGNQVIADLGVMQSMRERVAMVGGDEFAMLYGHTTTSFDIARSVDRAKRLLVKKSAGTIRKLKVSPEKKPETPVKTEVTFSFGATRMDPSEFDPSKQTPEDILKIMKVIDDRADAAVKHSKYQGKNQGTISYMDQEMGALRYIAMPKVIRAAA